jgi:hypothetical protein
MVNCTEMNPLTFAFRDVGENFTQTFPQDTFVFDSLKL